MKKFPKFWYESNACWGWVESLADLEEKCDLQTDPMYGGLEDKEEFLDKSVREPGTDSFGTRMEHTGKETLREFLEKNEIKF